MKNSILILIASSLLIVSCKKATQPIATSFQLEMRNYYTGDSIPNAEFVIHGISSSENDFIDTTNDYGRYNTIFEHTQSTNFECAFKNNSPYFLASQSGQIQGGENTELQIDVIPHANFDFNFDCSGSGEIQFVERYIIYPFIPGENVLYAPGGQSYSISSPYCGSSTYNKKVFSGTWVVAYQKKTSASALWQSHTDTVYVAPGEDYVYSIVY